MATIQHCILLSIGLMAPGIWPRTASLSEALPVSGTVSADTSLAWMPEARRISPALWPRCDPHFRWQGRRESAQGPWTSSAAAGAPWGGTATRAEPVADPNLWGANGNVLDIARSGNTLYIAGSFRSVGENSGGFVPIDAHSGEALRPFPKVAGSVAAIVPDGSGGWYIGGEFTAVGGKPRSCLARIRADGSVTDWNPSVTGSPGYIDPPAVVAIAVWRDRVFVGGGFRELGGQPRMNLGCVDARTGGVLDWRADTHVDGWVSTLAVHDSTLFVGGVFASIGGQARSYLAALDAVTGAVTPWQANPDYAVLALLVHDDTLYAGGQFGWIGGGSRSLLAALDVHTAQLLPFNAHVQGIYVQYAPTPRVSALALMGDTLYAAGNFTQIGGRPLASLAALNATTGNALAWTPDSVGPRYEGFPPRLCTALAARGATLYVGGSFETLEGRSHPFVAALSRETGAAGEWDPKLNDAAYALAVTGDTVWLGGSFASVGEWRHRAGLAAIDLTTGAVKPWNPNPDGIICTAVAVSGDRVFATGDFASIGGLPQPRSHLAALDTANGEVTDWNPGANSVATVLLLQGDTLYAGGEFTQIGGQPRNYLAAINATTGDVLPWDPGANWPVYAMARSGGTIYVGGIFQQLGGQRRRGIGAVDAATGALTAWNPDTDNSTVEALLVSGNTIYVGGMFGQIGGQARRSIAALDAATGNATPWYPQPTAWGTPTEVKALALMGGTLCVGGAFGSIGGQPRICLAAVDTSTGLATDWDPGLDGLVWSLAADGNTLYAGGGFTRAGGLPCAGLAAFSLVGPPPPSPPPSRLAIAGIWPNPIHSVATLRFALPSSGPASLAVFDIQGRRMATILRDEARPAGIHDVPVRTDGWPGGMYFCRLEAGGSTATRKMVVAR
jgi:hypothetical protein